MIIANSARLLYVNTADFCKNAEKIRVSDSGGEDAGKPGLRRYASAPRILFTPCVRLIKRCRHFVGD